MKRLAAAALVSLSLAGCAGGLPSLQLDGAVSLNTMLGIEGAYGSVLTAARSYKELPLCLTGTVATVTAPCAQRSVIVRLQAADLQAVQAIRKANDFIKTYPTVDATNVVSAASTAVRALQGILAGAK